MKRRAASEWIGRALGVPIPHETDQSFRAALADGVVLCRLVNWLRPGSIPRVVEASSDAASSHGPGEVLQTFENVTNFIAAARALTGEAFSARDLEESGEERPGVAACILSLRDLAAGRTPPGPRPSLSPWASGQGGTSGSGGLPPLPSPAGSRGGVSQGWAALATPPPGSSGGAPQPLTTPPRSGFSFTPAAAQLVAKAGLAASAADAPDGLNHLMRSCTHMLRSRMGMPASSPAPPGAAAGAGEATGTAAAAAPAPAFALDAVGPVLESVLSNLTSEYEKRLLSKDQEFKLAQEAQASREDLGSEIGLGCCERMRRQIGRLQAEVASWKAAAEAAPPSTPVRAPSRQSRDGTSTDAAELVRVRVVAAESAERLAEVEARLEGAEGELSAARAAAASAAAAADGELESLRSALASFEGLQARYDAVAAQNRQLYNAVQDARGALRVYCRVRPAGVTGDGGAGVVDPGEEGSLGVYSAKHGKVHTFRFDAVFGQGSTQEEVYEETAPLVRCVLDGYNVCIFAYGQTGSGKTHTMSGTDVGTPAGRGVNYRTLDDLFALRDERAEEVEYTIRVQLLEIYNESLRDLLVGGEGGGSEPRGGRTLTLNNTARSGANVPDATQVEVGCTEDVLRVMDLGQRNRAVAETRMNERSSRSHQVLTILVEGQSLSTHARTHACLHLIDLAGSERIGRSGAEGQQLVEAQHINKSLSALGNVMHALASKAAHVPFRDSKLTQLLQDSLSGQAKTMMFVHVAPEASSLSETLSTLNFGKGVTEITLGAAKKNAESGAVFEARDAAGRAEREAAAARDALASERARRAALEREVADLRAALAVAGEGGGDQGGTGIMAYRPSAGTPKAAGAGGGSPGRVCEAAKPRALPSMSKLNLARLGEGEGGPASRRSPGVAGSSASKPSRIPGMTPPPATARAARTSPSLSSSIPRPVSARGGPSDSLSSRRASLTGLEPRNSSRLSLGRSGGGEVPSKTEARGGLAGRPERAPSGSFSSRVSGSAVAVAPLSSRGSEVTGGRRWA